ncbi:MAG: ACP S-malonyltransferase [Candidatus Fournierella pullistercoris]|uniref:Malonyl CoA-acyl carrier protein transacylase n=1 Tax=Candidatus Allofournierella pullistercoris TaxID=2838597 RepID=A0A948WRD3_9FIRM|nr:ACP S-malonyltransferase [Candidatus Fournierella pullistercoris]
MKLGLLFAGQGSQRVGMGQDLYDRYPLFRSTWDSLAAQVDFDLTSLCFNGPEELLSQTRYTQPCMVTFALSLWELLHEQGIQPDAVAGLSLGEYSALACAGVLDKKQAVSLVAYRGQAMEQAVSGRPCGMAAVLGLERSVLQQVCQQAKEETGALVEIANYNCPGQMAIAGDQQAVDRACELAKEAGAKRCLPLKVSGPFHTSLMKPAGDALAQRFQSEHFSPMQIPVYFNCLGDTAKEPFSIPQLLEQQVQSSVYMEDILSAMERDGITHMLEIGPGKTLTGLVKKTCKGMAVRSIETADDLEAALAWLKGETV